MRTYLFNKISVIWIKMNIVFILVFFIQSAIAHFNNNNNNNDVIEGTHCQLKSGEKGTCIRLNMCSSAKDLLKEHKYPDTCGFKEPFPGKLVPIVCCPKKQRKIERLSEKKCKYFELSRFGFIAGTSNEDIKTDDIPKEFSRFPLVEDENTKDIPTQFSRFPDETESQKNIFTTEKIIDDDAVIFEDDSFNFGSNSNSYSGNNYYKKTIQDNAVIYKYDARTTFPLVLSRFGLNSNSLSGNHYKRSYEPNKKKSTDDFLFGKDYSQFSYSPTQKYVHNWFDIFTQDNYHLLKPLDLSNEDIRALILREAPSYILGGENSKPSEFPHMAALGYESNNEIIWLCGGSLISEQYVLTAAHCLTSKDYGAVKKIRLGEINRFPNQQSHHQDFDVEKVIPYPLYSTNSNYHDIALIKLNGEAIINKYVNTACLFTEEIIPPGLELVATGWGLTSSGGKKSDILQKVGLTLFSEEYCRKVYPLGSKLSQGILHKQQICVGGKENDKDTCQGDSGGPLQIKTSRSMNEDVYYIVGVTSFGKFCGNKNIPGVYSRVSFYFPWIQNIVWPGNQ